MAAIITTIAIATAVQIGTLIWLLSGMKTDISGILDWRKGITVEVSTLKTEMTEVKTTCFLTHGRKVEA